MKELKGIKVPAQSIDQIRTIADNIRIAFQVGKPYLDIVSLLEFKLHFIGLIFEVARDEELGDDDALTFPDKKIIRVKNSVYENACNGNGRDRFTLAHEIGHLFLHQGISLGRSYEPRAHQFFEDSEWQADTFAAEIMMPLSLYQTLYPDKEKIKTAFGVSYAAAGVRAMVLEGRREVKKRI